MPRQRFIDIALEQPLTSEKMHRLIDTKIDEWHRSDTPETLHSFLGLTWEEYSSFVRSSSALEEIVKYRRKVTAKRKG